jgi:hypothetical protein
VNYVVTNLISTAFVVLAVTGEPLRAQSTPSVVPIFVDYEAPPTQLVQFAANVDSVVAVRIESIRFESPVDTKSGRPRDVTRYDVRVMDTLNSHPQLPQSQGILTITRSGGHHLEGGRTITSAEQGFEPFVQGGEYVLFLQWNMRRNDYDIAYGPDGSFELQASGTIRSLGRSEMAKLQAGQDKNKFLADVRTATRR